MKKVVILLVLINITYFLWQTRSQLDVSEMSIGAPIIPTLVLLSEAPERTTPRPTDAPQTAPVSVPDPEAGVSTVTTIPSVVAVGECAVLSGFIDQLASQKAIDFLSKQKVIARLDVVESQADGDYLVYLPPFESHDAALKKLHELKVQAIDSFIIGDGERTNGISLGVFSKEESAQKMQNLLKVKGYNALIGKGTRTYRQYTLQINQPTEFTEGLLADLSKNYAGGKLIRNALPCPVDH